MVLVNSIKLFDYRHTVCKTWEHSDCGSKSSQYTSIKGGLSARTSISCKTWILFRNITLQFTAFFFWQHCHFTACCVQSSPNIEHNVEKHSAFCHFTGWTISYCSFIYLLQYSVCACSVTRYVVKLEGGVWQNCK